jgi:hypothetical protein
VTGDRIPTGPEPFDYIVFLASIIVILILVAFAWTVIS